MIARMLSKCVRAACRSGTILTDLNHFQQLPISSKGIRKFCTESNEDIEEKPFNLNNLLYPKTADQTILRIRSSSLYELSKYVTNIAALEKSQVCQLILSLSHHISGNKKADISLDPVMSRIDQVLDELTIEEITVTFHYLNKLNFSIRQPTMEKMTNLILNEIESKEDFPPNLLFHFTSSMKAERGLYALYLEAATLPQLTRQLESCSNLEDFNSLTMVFTNISNIVSLDLLCAYKRKTDDLLTKDIINETAPKQILKILNFLSFPHWAFRNSELIRRLILELEENIKSSFDARHLIVIARAVESQLESAKLIPSIVSRAQQLLKEDASNVTLLPLAILNQNSEQRAKTTQIVRDFLLTYQISSNQSGDTLQTVFKILRLLKISDIDLCDLFWTKTINELYLIKECNLTHQMTKQIHKYMFFNNNLGGTYRHLEFEMVCIDMLMRELKTVIPKDFANFSSFVIAYGDVAGQRAIPKYIVDKIESLHEQFSIKDCVQISRGVQIMLMDYKRSSPELDDQIDSINFSLSKSAERHLKGNPHLSEINSIIRAFTTRRGTKHSYLFHKMMEQYEKVCGHHS